MKFDTEKLPKHIGIIMDGNGRWATSRHLPRKMGHRAGVKTLKKILRAIYDLGIPYVSIFAFSTENWDRPKDEVDALFQLIKEYVSIISTEKDNIKISFMGDISKFPDDVKDALETTRKTTENCTGGVLNLGLNYGSRAEIVSAANRAVLGSLVVTEESFGQLLYSAGSPDLDMVIRTSGEMRLSNFMLYQSAYSEMFFTPTLWPDFNKNELYKILDEFCNRNRRYGKI